MCTNNVSLRAYEDGLESADQGVYANILRAPGFRHQVYVGSAWGYMGMKRRIREHRSPVHRARHFWTTYHYRAWAQEGVVPQFICLVRFQEPKPWQMVVIAEAAMMLLFGSLAYAPYRPESLHFIPVAPDCAVNRSDALGTSKAMGNPSIVAPYYAYQSRRDVLANAQAGGLVHVVRSDDRGFTGYHWFIHQGKFRLPSAVARRWDMDNDPQMHVMYHQVGEHPCYAMDARPDDAGKRLGILAVKFLNGRRYEWWVQMKGDRARRLANSLVAWLNNEILDPETYPWRDDQLAFFGSKDVTVPSNRISNGVHL